MPPRRNIIQKTGETSNTENLSRGPESQVDWAAKMRIRPPEFETRICDVKYHVSLHSRCRYSDIQDVCMAIESLTTLDLPMVVESIGIYELKRPYYMLAMTYWFLQAISVIPRGSWGDVARRFTLIRWGPNCYFGLGGPKNCFHIIMLSFVNCVDRFDLIVDRDYDGATLMDLKSMCTLDLSKETVLERKTDFDWGKQIPQVERNVEQM
ncbi:aldose 1-epimerase [Dorcoceras hygrometricum]|uniref:Aldose 1-epimerase n=1 Tax=Dorcoceras hygrometricum TaxID=472368 RepID=A0A2Z7BBV8_9LAMI|nr:aldose 1-epimerase [Dorcoceras hygrometricum]